MKKIILIVMTVITVISLFAISAFAMEDVPYTYVMEFYETKKAYPLADSVEDTVGFFEYYEVDSTSREILFTKDYEDAKMDLKCTRNTTNITITANLDGSYPNYGLYIVTPSDGNYTDFGIVYDSGRFKIVGINQGVKTVLNEDFSSSFYEATSNGGHGYEFSEIVTNIPTDGYYVSFPKTSEEVIAPSTLENILDGASSFVKGIGSAFGLAFTSVFFVDGQLNVLAIILLAFFGIALGYGVIRYIIGTFRKET